VSPGGDPLVRGSRPRAAASLDSMIALLPGAAVGEISMNWLIIS
jgi:hypothetical protein